MSHRRGRHRCFTSSLFVRHGYERRQAHVALGTTFRKVARLAPHSGRGWRGAVLSRGRATHVEGACVYGSQELRLFKGVGPATSLPTSLLLNHKLDYRKCMIDCDVRDCRR